MRPIIKTKPGINNNDAPISLNLFKISGPKLAPIVQPKSALQIGLGFLGLGKYIRYIPYPVVSGFMTAIGVIILLAQILPSLGYNPKEDLEYVDQFKPQAEEIILEKILKRL